MKKSISMLALLFTVIGCNGSEVKSPVLGQEQKESQDPKLKRYEVKSGVVKYESIIEGKVLGSRISGSGTSELYFKDWGAIELVEDKESKKTITKMFGKESTQEESVHNMSKLDNGKAFYVDFKNKEIRSQNDLAMESIKTFNNGDANQTGKDMLTGLGGEKIGVEKVLGFECEIWSLMGTKQWIYKGVTLKMEASIMGVKTTQIAVEAEFNKTVNEVHFQLPDFKLIEQEMFDSSDYYEETEEDQVEMKKQAEKMKDMTYEEYKEMLLKEDEEANEMSEDEIKQSYSFFKMAIKRMNQ